MTAMRSFALAAFASLTFGLFCSAAPTPIANTDALALKRSVEVPSVFERSIVEARGGDEDKNTLSYILNGVVHDVEVIVEKIKVVDHTVEALTPLLEEVKEILVCAIAAVKGLVGLDLGKILKDVVTGLVLDVKGLAALIADVLRVVLCLLELVLSLVTDIVKGGLLPLICEIVSLLAELVSCILDLVGGLLVGLIAEVLLLVGDLVGFILSLKVEVIIKVLCINITL